MQIYLGLIIRTILVKSKNYEAYLVQSVALVIRLLVVQTRSIPERFNEFLFANSLEESPIQWKSTNLFPQ
jgi:hypothetical protein